MTFFRAEDDGGVTDVSKNSVAYYIYSSALRSY